MAAVFEVPNLPGVILRALTGDDAALTGRAIVDEQEFPVLAALRKYALHCLLQELHRRVEERHDYRHQSHIVQITQRQLFLLVRRRPEERFEEKREPSPGIA